MNIKNMYTSMLCILGLAFLTWIGAAVPAVPILQVFPILILIAVLDVFPVRMLSGTQYSGSIIGMILLLVAFGPEASSLGIFVSVSACYLKDRFSSKADSYLWFRAFAIYGIFGASAFAAHKVLLYAESLPLHLQIFMTTLVFEAVHVFLLAGLMKTVYRAPFFWNIRNKLMELVLPLILCTLIVPHLMDNLNWISMTQETLFFLFWAVCIIFFSRKYLMQAELRKKTIEEFIQLYESKLAKHMEGHGKRVGRICEELSIHLSYPLKTRNQLVYAAIVHDIGKVFLSPHLFVKRGALSLSEEAEYAEHSKLGHDIILSFFEDQHIALWIKHHHERYDGKGYPEGLTGTGIPLESRILAVCNELDHLMQTTSSDEKVHQMLRSLSGKALDPALLDGITPERISQLRRMLGAEQQISPVTPQLPQDQDGYEPSKAEQSNYIGKTYMLEYSDGTLSGEGLDLPLDEIGMIAGISKEREKSFYEIMEYGGCTYESHFFYDPAAVRIFIIDITPLLIYREKLHLNTMRSYQDIIETLSHGKISIHLSENEVLEYLGTPLGAMDVVERKDVPLSRAYVCDFIWHPQDTKKQMSIKLAVTEGVTNMIKHANQGKVSVHQKGGVLQVLIQDKGSGIPLHELPKTILVSGYSSKRSLGRGFSLMCTSSDHVVIHTSSKGTCLLLEFEIHEPAPAADPMNERERIV
ncbi:HD domain-containing phosphohydrolase [Paenibacillus mucilaginosus]|uniref:RpfG n=1 Tax=Paenibacillus mucilaginosus (strain KNP414) TaxID=1036673 RepID=F8FGA0_PAEMK|nr:HD domain-containing phosphohydrolase [Paenibacillus mucilaginosus]AEI43920.1 RpfG [Paenibacillus mucilaginosus KNP414]MCG7212577.1 HD domain-containing protein [Paenibacillus mucilaginosus]WDM25396.1 HD domain-containing protein [Paenibacillus mucilaginosus]